MENKSTLTNDEIIKEIESLLNDARKHIFTEVNNTLLITYMKIGEIIFSDFEKHSNDENYKRVSLRNLSKELTRKYGRGFSKSNLNNMIRFYLDYNSVQTLSGQLSWSHYCELLSISDREKRRFYEIECNTSKWSVRELRRQIDSSLFERILLSNGKVNKEMVLKLASKGNEIVKPQDIVKDPYVFEFLGIPENKPMMESNLEEALVKQIEKFLL